MLYLISTYWLWMLGALVLGVVVGWLMYDRASGWSRPAALIFFVGLVLALLKVFPGSVGLWLETALLLFASYILGGLIGALVHRQIAGEPAPALKSVALAAGAGAAGGAAAMVPARTSGTLPGRKPAGMDTPAAGGADNLKLIKGIGPKNETILHGLGTFKFQQIAGWSAEECKWVGHHMAFPGRVEREHWVEQAKLLAGGGETDFARGVKAGTIKVDASADAPMGEADIARMKQDVSARAAAKAAADAAAMEAAAKAKADAAAKQAAVAKEAAAREVAAKAAADAAANEAAAKAASDKAAAEKAASDKAAADRAASEKAAREAAAKAAADAKIAEMAKAEHPGQRPAPLAAPNVGPKDDLKLIKGIGPKNEAVLHSLGIWQFAQIADWKPEAAIWVGHHMAFPGRVEREHWIEQARLLGAGMDTEHSAGVKSGTIKMDDSADAPLSEAEAGALKSSLPEVAPVVADEGKFEGKRPLGLAKPRGGKADDLKRIRGIGPQNEGRLHGLGIWHFDQIASWTPAQVQWVGGYLAFPGRIDREDWMAQAKLLARGQDTEFSKRVDKGLVATSRDQGSKGPGKVADGTLKH